MLIRLNTMLTGRTGAQKEVAEMYVQFLNKRISPLVPSRSSVGEADITILAHIGLAMIGEGEVTLDGRRMQASEALKTVSLTPVKPFAKDALAIFSSNAYSAALACLAVVEAEHLLQISSKVFALSLEGLNGNVAPFLPYVHEIRPFRSQGKAAEQIRADLQGSYLWQVSDQRALQDPLSYRTASYIFGTAGETLEKLKALLQIQINSSDDNPAVIIGISPSEDSASQVSVYFVTQGKIRGAVIPTANFEPFPWVLELESLGIALSHVSRASAQRTLRLATPEFTNLSRFLAPDDKTIAYGAIQKASISLDAENRELSNPVSADFFPVAGDIEDLATEAARAAARIIRMIDNLYYIHGIELMHAAQAIDLRQQRLRLGIGTKALYEAYRAEVTFLDRDRVLTNDIAKSHDFLKKLPIANDSKRKQ
jgi:histidine ammonia-lyase